MSIRRRVLWVVPLVLLMGVVAVPLTFRANSEARAALRSDSRVEVREGNGVIRFSPMSLKDAIPIGLLIFPERMVDPVAYAPYARAVAAAGFPVILVPLPRRGMFDGGSQSAAINLAMIAVHDDERAAQWVMAGHAYGAVVAARLALELTQLGAKSLGGLMMLGTAQPHDSALMRLKVGVTKIVGTNDGIASIEAADANRRFLPPGARFVRIEGGNHSQFAWYGYHPGDRSASITAQAQHEQLINTTIDVLRIATDVQRNTGYLAR
jgi:hypothetical protein